LPVLVCNNSEFPAFSIFPCMATNVKRLGRTG